MGGMKVSELDFLYLLPVFMRDDEAIIALSESMNKLMGELGSRIPTIRTWDELDHMTEPELDELAWELNIDWWDSGFSLETKRAVAKSCCQVCEKRGTKWAVEELITSAFGMGKVTPWFEYGGEPFRFKIQTNATLTKDGMAYFLNMIDKVKSARDHVEMIEVIRKTDNIVHAGITQISHSKCVIL